MSAEVIHLRGPRDGPRARVELVDVDDQYAVGIRYLHDGDFVLAGVFRGYAEALDAARGKARLLGLSVLDLSGTEPWPPKGGAAA